MKNLNILMLGDLIGTPGIEQVYLKLPELKKKEKIDFVIANGENSDNGFGITEDIISRLKIAGVDVITSGNHIWSNRDAGDLLNRTDYLLRPANYPKADGKGYVVVEYESMVFGVVNLIGRHNMIPLDCPFQTLTKLLKTELKKCTHIFVDFHAELLQEKKALAYKFDGEVTIVAGTHTHVQTADETILSNGTAYITDLGLCGGLDSIIGMEKEGILNKLTTQINNPFIPSKQNGHLQGLITTISHENNKAIKLKRIDIKSR